MDTPEQIEEARLRAQLIKTRKIAQQALQDVLANTEDREDDRIYEEHGAEALAVHRMMRGRPTSPLPQNQTQSPKKS